MHLLLRTAEAAADRVAEGWLRQGKLRTFAAQIIVDATLHDAIEGLRTGRSGGPVDTRSAEGRGGGPLGVTAERDGEDYTSLRG